MKRKSLCGQHLAGFLAMVLIGLASTVQAGAQQCSAAGLSGKWAFSYTGTVILPTGPVAVASVGHFTSRPDGTLTGSETRSIGGDIANETLTATFSVNRNCTANFQFKVFDSGVLARTSTVYVVYEDNGRAARGIFSSLILPDGTVLPSVITVTATRMFLE